ncbi:MAG TPA: hypothetical protein VK571_05395 [Gemmatimonadaceae bacterium]|nr:hypothetical protein [Gemmatimonadaceae bacterium]
MSIWSQLPYDERLILAARALSESMRKAPESARLAMGPDGVEALTLMGKLADRLEVVIELDRAELRATLDRLHAIERAAAGGVAGHEDARFAAVLNDARQVGHQAGRDAMLAEIKAAPYKFLGGDPRTPSVASFAPAPFAGALLQTFALNFAITPHTARSMVSESDAACLCTDELEAGGDRPMRLRVTIEGGSIRAYRSGTNELGETVWINATNVSVYFHGLSLDSESITAVAFRFLTRPRGAGGTVTVTPAAAGVILSLGEF